MNQAELPADEGRPDAAGHAQHGLGHTRDREPFFSAEQIGQQGGAQAWHDCLGLRVGENVREGPQADPGPVGHREASGGEQAPGFADSPADRGAVDAGQQGQDRVRQVVAQVDERGGHPVDEHEPVPGTRSDGPSTRSTATTSRQERSNPTHHSR